MPKPPLAGRLRSGPPLLGTLMQSASPAIAQQLVGAGLDWLFLDGEHGPFDDAAFRAIVHAVGDQVYTLVRVPVLDAPWIARALATGADGVIVPHVDSAADAWRAVEDVGGAGCCVVQAESADAVEAIDGILDVAGVDLVFVGPFDLAASLGLPGAVEHPRVQAAIGRVVDACRAAAVPSGIFGLSSGFVAPWVARGVQLVTVGIEATQALEVAR